MPANIPDPDPARAHHGVPVRAAALVVGATGILRPAALSLLSVGMSVVGVGRDAGRVASLETAAAALPGSLHTLALDAAQPGFVDALGHLLTRQSLGLEAALVYAPATSPAVTEELMYRWKPRLVELLTSESVGPLGSGVVWTVSRLPQVGDTRRRLVLGWRRESGHSRWHSAEEVSGGALAALASSGDRILGSVHPWSDRP
jgi:hypothetical protein